MNTTPPMQPMQKHPAAQLADLLMIINKLVIKAFSASSKEAFQFIVLNDTLHVIKYDRAYLWSFEGVKPTLLGISGQQTFNKSTPLFLQWEKLVEELRPLNLPEELKEEHFKDKQLWQEVNDKHATILWLPLLDKDKPLLGLWLELGEEFKDKSISKDFLNILRSSLLLGYSSAYLKYRSKWKDAAKHVEKKWIKYTAAALLLSMLVIRVPLRVAAPCEVVPKDPVLVTAPLEGIIQKIIVKPGENIKKDQLLVEYDKQISKQNLRAAQKQVQVMQSQVDRAETLGLTDPKALNELRLLKLKLQKEKVALDLAKYQNSLLDIRAPAAGIAILDSPEEWMGKPVKIGEKIMTLGSPENSKVRIWIPENDNIPIDFHRPVKVMLNISPTETYYAELSYIANETTLHDNYIPSFVADAEWEQAPTDTKLGLKGTAILYGERVSLFYFLVRKPWMTVRNFFGY